MLPRRVGNSSEIEMRQRSNKDKEEAVLLGSSGRKGGWPELMKIVMGILVFVAGAVLGLSLGVSLTRQPLQSQPFSQTELYPENYGKDSLSFKNFIRPSHLMHAMTDEELLWRASMVAKREEYPYKRLPKVAFLFLIRGSLPLSPLWDRFFKGGEGHFTVYVHAAPGYNLTVSKNSAFYGRQIPSQETQWGSMSLVDAERRLLANALLDFSNERFVLLSDGCIPLYNFVTIYRYLLDSEHSFVHSYDEDTENGRGRYNHRLAPAIKLSQWRKGAQWFELHRSLAVNIVADDKYYNLFNQYAGALNYPDEHYIQTYLSMLYGAMIANRSLTWADWSKRGPHPATFGPKNITEGFIRYIRNNATTCSYNFRPASVCFLFARKFSPDALEPLLNISSTVMRF